MLFNESHFIKKKKNTVKYTTHSTLFNLKKLQKFWPKTVVFHACAFNCNILGTAGEKYPISPKEKRMFKNWTEVQVSSDDLRACEATKNELEALMKHFAHFRDGIRLHILTLGSEFELSSEAPREFWSIWWLRKKKANCEASLTLTPVYWLPTWAKSQFSSRLMSPHPPPDSCAGGQEATTSRSSWDSTGLHFNLKG